MDRRFAGIEEGDQPPPNKDYGSTFSDRFTNPELWKDWASNLIWGRDDPNMIKVGFSEAQLLIFSGGTGSGYTFTKSALKHLDEIVKYGKYAGQLARPFMRSPLTIQEIMATGKGIVDATAKGALRYDVPGVFRGTKGTWELVIDPNKNIIYHFNFVY